MIHKTKTHFAVDWGTMPILVVEISSLKVWHWHKSDTHIGSATPVWSRMKRMERRHVKISCLAAALLNQSPSARLLRMLLHALLITALATTCALRAPTVKIAKRISSHVPSVSEQTQETLRFPIAVEDAANCVADLMHATEVDIDNYLDARPRLRESNAFASLDARLNHLVPSTTERFSKLTLDNVHFSSLALRDAANSVAEAEAARLADAKRVTAVARTAQAKTAIAEAKLAKAKATAKEVGEVAGVNTAERDERADLMHEVDVDAYLDSQPRSWAMDAFKSLDAIAARASSSLDEAFQGVSDAHAGRSAAVGAAEALKEAGKQANMASEAESAVEVSPLCWSAPDIMALTTTADVHATEPPKVAGGLMLIVAAVGSFIVPPLADALQSAVTTPILASLPSLHGSGSELVAAEVADFLATAPLADAVGFSFDWHLAMLF